MRTLSPAERADLEALADAELRVSKYARALLEIDDESTN